MQQETILAMQKLLNKVDALAAQISNADVLNNTVSQGNIGWHIEHSCLVIIKITETIQASNPIAYHAKFNFKKWIDNEINKASSEKNMNKRNEMLLSIEKLLLTVNSSMDYTDAADATHVTNLENFKSRSFLIMNSFVNMFKNVSKHTNKK